MALPPDIADRETLALELHARPSQALAAPARMTLLAVMVAPSERPRELQHLRDLCAQWNIDPPTPEDAHFGALFGEVDVRWERHGEFSSYTFLLPELSPEPFSDPPIGRLPKEWIRNIPGQTLYAAHAKVARAGDELPTLEELKRYFGEQVPVGAHIGGGAGVAYTDFWIHADGFARFVVLDRSLTPRQAGRTLQRLFEIETYRMAALLALPIARNLSARIHEWEQALSEVSTQVARDAMADETIMQAITQLHADIESALARSEFRFGASRAYHDLIVRRIAELREQRIQGLQTINEFMSRRLSPAIATILSTESRLHALSARVTKVSTLLSTRVDIARAAQNQSLLAALNRRAEMQFHLQRAIEGLSTAAIVYYAAGLVGYLAKGAKSFGLNVNVDLAVAASVPVLTLLSVWAVYRAHKRISGLIRPAS
ncbi:MAG TPA: DUF3422 domain-containing protein [Rhodanobacteraceae bacterium]